jgi:hypothetical protein
MPARRPAAATPIIVPVEGFDVLPLAARGLRVVFRARGFDALGFSDVAVVAMMKTPRPVVGHQTPGGERSSSVPDKAACSSAIQASATESDGARQSPRGDNEPPSDTLGPFGIAERLNWANE